MKVQYRKSFLKDLKKLKRLPVYDKIFELTFTTLPAMGRLRELTNIIPMKGFSNRYRIRVGAYRVGIEVHGDSIEIIRVLHRREFYRYFP